MAHDRKTPVLLFAGLLAAACLTASPALAQRHMKEAVDQLQQARQSLRAARWSSQSRKKSALDAIDRAIEQARKGMQAGRQDGRNDDD
jgi:cell division protein FtsL